MKRKGDYVNNVKTIMLQIMAPLRFAEENNGFILLVKG
jgi:hypothetical protein